MKRETPKVSCEKGEICACVCFLSVHLLRKSLSLLVVMWLLVLPGCEYSFQPLKENNQYAFSIYGYLDASADTQWVRLTPARRQLTTDTIPEMTVTLEELETGKSSIMYDSLFQQANGFNFINVWATMDVKPEHTYRLQAERPDGATSSVKVSTPGDFPTPSLTFPNNDCLGVLRISGVERLADLQWIWYYRKKNLGTIYERIYRLPYRQQVDYISAQSHRLYMIPGVAAEKVPYLAGQTLEHHKSVFVAAGGPEWIADISSLRDIEYALPNGLSNVENGVGYVVGIVSKTIPYECD